MGGEKPTMLGSPQTCRGITPAWAGKSDIYETLGTDPEDHPRVGGEKPRPQSWQTASSGSPPRGRGKV